MPTLGIETEEITVFEIGERYIFKTYFDNDQLFKRPENYYNKDKYWFEIPECDPEEVRQLLDEYYYGLDVEDSVEDYCGVVDRKSANTLRNTVMRKHKGEHEILVMKDESPKKEISREGRCRPEKIRGWKGGLRMETSVTVVESSSEATSNRGNYKWFPLGNTNKRL